MKTFIDNRDGKKICTIVEEPKAPIRLVFVMHGLGGHKDQPHMRAIAEAFLECGYTVVTFDTTNSFGESDGDYQNATTTNYYADLEDVISWAARQPWYREPFALAGQSLGGICTALYAENYPDKVRALAPIATVVSGKLSLETHQMFPNSENLEQWKRQGIWITLSHDGITERRLKWSHMEDRLHYDLLPQVDKLTMPVLLIVGEKDERTPPIHQKILFDALPNPKEMHSIAGAEHVFHRPHEQKELKLHIKAWIGGGWVE